MNKQENESIPQQYKLYDVEYRFVSIVWEREPLSSGELVRLCQQQLDWKKSTTYTVLKKLCDRGILKNENAVVSALVKREQVQRYESSQVVDRAFDGSLPQFVAAFMSGRGLSEDEVRQLKSLIDSYEERSRNESD